MASDHRATRRLVLGATALGIGAAALTGRARAQGATAAPSAGLGNGGTAPGEALPTSPTGRPQPELTITQPLPEAERLGWAICGLGHFAENQILPAMGGTTRAKLAGFVTGNAQKGRALATHYGVPGDSIYDYDMAGLGADDRIDVVYVITPNSVHVDNVVAALEAGKHVFCEKPLGNSPEECQRMIDAARAAGRSLGVAYRAHFEPNNLAARDLLRNGDLGEVWYASSAHHRPLDPAASQDQWRMQRDIAGGGALVDIGIYCLNGILWFFDEMPDALVASTFSPPDEARFAEVEAIDQVQMTFPSGRRADFSSGYIANRKRITLWGSDAVAELDPATNYAGNRLMVHRASGTLKPQTEPSALQFTGEIDHFCAHVTDGVELLIPAEMGLRDVRLMEAIYRSARSRGWVRLNPDGTVAG